jgi:hypothetical protein
MSTPIHVCRFCGAGADGRSLEDRWGAAESDRQEREHDLEEDLRIEGLLNPPIEETHVEYEDALWGELYYSCSPIEDEDAEELPIFEDESESNGLWA